MAVDLWKSVPPAWKKYDDELVGGKGQLERYLELCEEELNLQRADIVAALYLFDVDRCPEEYLPYLARHLDMDLDLTATVARKRRTIANAVQLYKRKGRKEMLVDLIHLLTGWDVDITEQFMDKTPMLFNFPGTTLMDFSYEAVTMVSAAGAVLITQPTNKIYEGAQVRLYDLVYYDYAFVRNIMDPVWTLKGNLQSATRFELTYPLTYAYGAGHAKVYSEQLSFVGTSRDTAAYLWDKDMIRRKIWIYLYATTGNPVMVDGAKWQFVDAILKKYVPVCVEWELVEAYSGIYPPR